MLGLSDGLPRPRRLRADGARPGSIECGDPDGRHDHAATGNARLGDRRRVDRAGRDGARRRPVSLVSRAPHDTRAAAGVRHAARAPGHRGRACARVRPRRGEPLAETSQVAWPRRHRPLAGRHAHGRLGGGGREPRARLRLSRPRLVPVEPPDPRHRVRADRAALRAVAAAERVFGTYHLPGDAWPTSYGIAEDPVPAGYLRQLVFPFLGHRKTAPTQTPRA